MNEILLVARTLSNEKGVSEEVVLEAIEIALATAAKKRYKQEVNTRVVMDRETGEYQTFRYWDIVTIDEFELPEQQYMLDEAQEIDPTLQLGGIVEEPIDNIDNTRIAAQIAKQVIFKKIREAERLKVVEDYKDRIGQMVSGTVRKVTRDMVIVDLGNNAEAVLPRSKLINREVFRVNDRVRAILIGTDLEFRGPALLLDRTNTEMLIELFKLEVPEISEGEIRIVSAARDPGFRAKIAIKAKDKRIDPIGACVGMRGARVQAVSREIAGERVDIVLYDEEPAQFIINSLAPAEIESIVMDEDLQTVDVSVDTDNLAQAIGKGGQNIRLASEMTGWHINILDSKEVLEKKEKESDVIYSLFVGSLNIDEDMANLLIEEGFTNLEEIAYVAQDEMVEVLELEIEEIEELQNRAKDALLVQAIASESHLDEHQPAEDLLTMEGMSKELAYQLASHGIITMEDLANLAVDELLEIIDSLDNEIAGQLILTAREPWFKDQ